MLGVLLCLCDSDLLLGLRLRLERKKHHGLMAGMVSSFFFLLGFPRRCVGKVVCRVAYCDVCKVMSILYRR
jgi:hypothetical protein